MFLPDDEAMLAALLDRVLHLYGRAGHVKRDEPDALRKRDDSLRLPAEEAVVQAIGGGIVRMMAQVGQIMRLGVDHCVILYIPPLDVIFMEGKVRIPFARRTDIDGGIERRTRAVAMNLHDDDALL